MTRVALIFLCIGLVSCAAATYKEADLATTFYLIPISFIRTIYDNPNTYQDKHHGGIQVVSVDVQEHKVIFENDGISANLMQFSGRISVRRKPSRRSIRRPCLRFDFPPCRLPRHRPAGELT